MPGLQVLVLEGPQVRATEPDAVPLHDDRSTYTGKSEGVACAAALRGWGVRARMAWRHGGLAWGLLQPVNGMYGGRMWCI